MRTKTVMSTYLRFKVVDGVTEEEFAKQKADQEAERKAFEEVNLYMAFGH